MAAIKAALAYAFALLGVMVVIAPSAFAGDADLKKQVDQIASLCVEIFNKQDAAGVAALFATNAMGVASGAVAFTGTYTVDQANKTINATVKPAIFRHLMEEPQRRVISAISDTEMTFANPRTPSGQSLRETPPWNPASSVRVASNPK